MRVDDNVLICMRVIDRPEPVKGSKHARCSFCDADIWIGPQSYITAPAQTPLVCMHCLDHCIVSHPERKNP